VCGTRYGVPVRAIPVEASVVAIALTNSVLRMHHTERAGQKRQQDLFNQPHHVCVAPRAPHHNVGELGRPYQVAQKREEMGAEDNARLAPPRTPHSGPVGVQQNVDLRAAVDTIGGYVLQGPYERLARRPRRIANMIYCARFTFQACMQNGVIQIQYYTEARHYFLSFIFSFSVSVLDRITDDGTRLASASHVLLRHCHPVYIFEIHT
jgi:hypothetical protein